LPVRQRRKLKVLAEWLIANWILVNPAGSEQMVGKPEISLE